MPNIEIKARYPDLTKARQIAVRLGARFLWKDEQVDTYFETRAGKLKLRESRLNGSELLPYIKTDQEGLKRSDYAKIPLGDPGHVRKLLAELLGLKAQVSKQREVFLVGNVRVHLDEVKDLGGFLEFEAVFSDDSAENQAREREKVRSLMKEFGVGDGDLLEGSYPEQLPEPAGPSLLPSR